MATQLLDGYSYDKDSQRYRNGTTGRFVSRSNVIDLLDSQIKSTEKRMDALADALVGEKIAPAVYAERMRTEVRRVHLQQAALAKGGWDNLNQSDYGRVGAATRQAYAKIVGTTGDVVNGEASIAQVKNRNTAYAGSARKLYHRIEREQVTPTEGKISVEKRVLDPAAQHCDDCLNYADMGTQEKGILPVPGEDCQCGDNCRCGLRRWEIDAKELNSVIGEGGSVVKNKSELELKEVEGEIIPLLEKSVRSDGTVPLKLIAPGWGSTGYYSPDLLAESGPKVFRSGTKMFWDHPTATEETERPEGSLNNLAAVLVEDARWDAQGVDGPGLYAEAKTFGGYKEILDEIGPHIGVSIRASGKGSLGEAEGKKGLVINEITSAKSADFVTVPGAGGKIVQLFESARSGDIQPIESAKETAMSDKLELQLKEALDVVQQLKEQNEQLIARDARTNEALQLREAKDFVVAQLATSDLPQVTQTRLAESLSGKAPIVDGKLDTDSFKSSVDEAIKAEAEYLREAAGYSSGRITGMGSGGGFKSDDEHDIEESQKRLEKAFGRLGLSESNAEFATNGRGF